MSQFMPTHGFKWLTEEEIINKFSTSDDILGLVDDAEDGYILEVGFTISKRVTSFTQRLTSSTRTIKD
jgi:hypothetical protein